MPAIPDVPSGEERFLYANNGAGDLHSDNPQTRSGNRIAGIIIAGVFISMIITALMWNFWYQKRRQARMAAEAQKKEAGNMDKMPRSTLPRTPGDDDDAWSDVTMVDDGAATQQRPEGQQRWFGQFCIVH